MGYTIHITKPIFRKEDMTMKTYEVIYKETLVHCFFVEARNEQEAEKKFQQGLMNSEFDFSDGEIDKCSHEIKEV